MDYLEVGEGPPMKRTRSYQGPEIALPVVGTVEDDASQGSAVSAPSRIEGQEDGLSDQEGSVTSSIYEDILDAAEDQPYYASAEDEEGFNAEESRQIIARLREVGAEQFIAEYVTNGKHSVRHLLTAFGVNPEIPYEDGGMSMRLLSLCISRELRKRLKLPDYNTIDDAVELLQKSSRIMVITGAGISTSLGIPDFRSKNTGFYSQLLEMGYSEPEMVFDIHNFDDDPKVFYTLAKEILPVTDRCSTTHAFIKLLQDKEKLLTNYTQNIDNIEAIAGIRRDKLIQCHGSWAKASCRKCGFKVDGVTIFADVEAKHVPRCQRCVELLKVQHPKKRKRGSANTSRSRRSDFSDDESDDQYNIPEPGVMKPDITFFGEQLPNTFFDRLTDVDRDKVDLVVVLGTSLKVSPVSEIPNFIPGNVPHIYISREPVKHINFDIQLLGYCDDVVSELARRAGWTIDHNNFSNAKAEVTPFGVDGESECHWAVRIPGKEHTVQETSNPGE